MLATGWNYTIIAMAKHVASSSGQVRDLPWYWLIIGTLGFCIVLAGLIVFFVRLMREIRHNQLQSMYLARVTHELKTPLATMELSSSMLRGKNLEVSEAEQLWNSHQRELGRLKSNVDSLLLAARFDAKLFKPTRQLWSLEDWLQNEFGHWTNSLGDKIERQGPPLHGMVFSDAGFMKLITDNIIENARKYAKGTPKLKIQTSVVNRRGRSRWEIQFEDEGLGFDPTMEKKIFKPFVRAQATKTRSIPGTGLGLYLAASAAKKLGYRLYARSKGLGSGAVFVLEGDWA